MICLPPTSESDAEAKEPPRLSPERQYRQHEREYVA